MGKNKELYYCIWYKPEYAHTCEHTNAIIVNAISPEKAKEFCKSMISEEEEDWTEYNIYGTIFNPKNEAMNKVFEEQEKVAWEVN